MASIRLSEVQKRIRALPEDLRDLVEERVAILLESEHDLDEDEASRRAFEMETGQAFTGLASAKPRAAATTAKKKKA